MLKGLTTHSPSISTTLLSFLRPYSSLQKPHSIPYLQSRTRLLHLTGSQAFPKRRKFFSSNPHLQKSQPEQEQEEAPKSQKRKSQRSPASKNSLRRVAVEAQSSRNVKEATREGGHDPQPSTKVAIAALPSESCTDMIPDGYGILCGRAI